MSEKPKIGEFVLKFTDNKEWTEEEEKYGKTIAMGYIVGPDFEYLEKKLKEEMEKRVKEIEDHFKLKEGK